MYLLNIYHKYRKKVLYGKLKADVRDIISILCRYKDVEIIDGTACEDHIHLSVAIPPKYSISNFMGYLNLKKAARRQKSTISIRAAESSRSILIRSWRFVFSPCFWDGRMYLQNGPEMEIIIRSVKIAGVQSVRLRWAAV